MSAPRTAQIVVRLGHIDVRRTLATQENLQRALRTRSKLALAAMAEYVRTGDLLESYVALRDSSGQEPDIDITRAALYGFLVPAPLAGDYASWSRAVQVAHEEMRRLDAEVEAEIAAEEAALERAAETRS